MPNWCDSSYKCVGDLKEVKSLYKILKYMEKRKTSILPNGFGKLWLGNLVHKLGGDWKELRCRGEITDFSLDGNVLTINQMTAWCEQEGVREIIERTYPSIKVYFMAQESGCDVFCTNDASGDYFPERYFLDSNEDWEYFETIEDAAAFVSKIVGYDVEPNVTGIQEALDAYVEEHDDEDMFYSFHEFSFCDD